MVGRLLRACLLALVAAAGLTTAGVETGHGLNASMGGGCAAAAGVHHAALVVTHADGATITYCDAFAATTQGGQQVLDDSGIEKAEQQFGSYGEAVCQLDGEPAHYSTCFGGSEYWAIFVSRSGSGGAWSLSSQGVSSLVLGDGDAIGFRYDAQSGPATAPASPTGICPPPLPPATAVPSSAPTATAAPRPSAGGPAPSGHGGTGSPSPSAGSTPAPGAGTASPVSSPSPTVTPGGRGSSTSAGVGSGGAMPPPGPAIAPVAALLAAVFAAGLLVLLGRRAMEQRRR